MKAAALVDLPVDAGGGVIKTLNTIHAEVVAAAVRMFGIHQRKGDKGPSVRVPGGQDGQIGQAAWFLAGFQNRSVTDVFHADFQALGQEWSCLPQGAEGWRHHMLNHIDHALDKIKGPAAKGQLQPVFGAKEIGHHRE